MKENNHNFSSNVFYLFRWGDKKDPKVSCTFTVWVNKNTDIIHFQVDDGRGKYDSLRSVYIKKSDIIAFKDDSDGKVKIKGLNGEYTILNQKLLEKCITQGLIEIAN